MKNFVPALAGLALALGCATSPETLTKDQMTGVTQQIVLKAPIDKAWQMLAALDRTHTYDPAVDAASFLSGPTEGIGARQHMVQDGGKTEIDSRVTEWNEGRSISMVSERISGIPLAKFMVTMSLAQTAEGTTLTTNYHYAMTGIAAMLPTKGAVAAGLRRNLVSFKHAIETGEPVVDLETFKKEIAPKYASVSTDPR